MTKAFFEAFPGVSPDDELICDLLKHTTVTRLTMDPEKTVLKVYLDCDRLISRKDMDKVEETVEEQITQPHGMKTKIIERFHLSGLYTARNLMKSYRPSILYELRRYQKCIYTMFKSADISFTDDDTCVITVEDTLIYRSYADELKNIMAELVNGDEYGVVLRAKGIVMSANEGEWLHFNYVTGESSVEVGAADYTGRFCVIGSKLHEDSLRELFMGE